MNLKELVKENDFDTLVQYLPLVNKYYTIVRYSLRIKN